MSGMCLFTSSVMGVQRYSDVNIVLSVLQVFDRTGQYKFQFGVAGKEEGQLYYPRKVAVIRNSGKFVVCDRGNERSRLQIFTKNGHFVRKIAIR